MNGLNRIFGIGSFWLIVIFSNAVLSACMTGQVLAAECLPDASDWVAQGAASWELLGYSISAAGDVNGDGYGDVLIGAPGDDFDSGKTELYFGGASGVSSSASWTITGSFGEELGSTLSGVGDVNGDGFDDVVAAADGANGGKGRVRLYFGGASGPASVADWEWGGTDRKRILGYELSGAGDIDGDGYDDFLACEYEERKENGYVYVLYGGMSGVIRTQRMYSASPKNFGYAIAAAGDVNGDGYADVIAGYGKRNKAYVFAGSSAGLEDAPMIVLEESVAKKKKPYYGASVSGAGDVNGDGFDDVLVGAYNESNGDGRAYLYMGSATGVIATAAWTGDGSADAQYGCSVSSAGDVNADGLSDLLIGAGGVNAESGAAYVYLGSTSGVVDAIYWQGTGFAGSFFGGAALSAGDVNADGADDLMISSYAYNFFAGRVDLFYSRCGRVEPVQVDLTNAVINIGENEVSLYVDSVPGQSYDLIEINTKKYSDAQSNDWTRSEQIVATGSSVIFSNRVDDLAPGELRLYRVAPTGGWEPDVDIRSASPEVYLAQNIRLYPGRNWISFAGIPTSMKVKDIFPAGLPSGSSAATSAALYLYDLADSSNPTGTLWYNGVHWQFKDSGDVADDFELPLLQGLIVGIPAGTTSDVAVVSRLRTNTQTRVIAGAGKETFVSINLPGAMHPKDMNLLESGFTGSSRSMRSDRICKWDRVNQRIQDNIWYWYDTRDERWETTANVVLPDNVTPFCADDAIIIRTAATSSGFDWILPVYYTPPTREMTP